LVRIRLLVGICLAVNVNALGTRRTSMKVVVVANPKGGAGKSTLSTNIAGYFASCGHRVMLGDADMQQSSRLWLQQRPDTLPPIATWEFQADLVLTAKPPEGTTHVVIDTPGGMHGWRLREVIQRAHKVIIPVMPSLFDMQATSNFLVELREIAHDLPTQIRVVGNRVDARTISAAKLQQFTASLDVEVLTYLRDTQYYLHMAAHGLSLFDLTPSKVPKDLEQWLPICAWLDH
jgi:chromosome partitioning protein